MSPLVLAVEAHPSGVAAVTLEGGSEGAKETCLLPVDTVVLNHVRSGDHIDATRWREIKASGQLILATRHGLDLLSRRHRTEHELHQRLARRYGEAAADGAVARLSELGYLDDAAWAKQYVASPTAAVRGRALLQHELRRRGVADSLVAEALEDHDDLAAAQRAAMKRARTLRDLDSERRKRRLYDFLRRRGFSDNAARPAMQVALAALEEESEAQTEDGQDELAHREGGDALVAEPVAEALDTRDDHAAAHRAAMKRARALRHLDGERRKRRLYDFLRRRGFSDSAARPAMQAALASLEETSEGQAGDAQDDGQDE